MEIPDPQGQAPACSTCGPLSWLYSLRRERWVAFVGDPLDAGTLRIHRCQHGQDPATWRHIRQGSPPTGDYLEARNKITGRDER